MSSDKNQKNKSSLTEPKKMNKIKSSVFSRGVSLAKMGLSAGAGLASHKMGSAFRSDEKKQDSWQSFLTSQAANMASGLGELKGSLMKAGQMLSMYGEHFLPPEANEFLKALQSDSAPIEWILLEKELKQRLPPERIAELEIDPKPIGTASLGQVHKARIKHSGEWIALKIQYPGVDKAIDSDLKALRSIFGMLKFLPKGPTMDSIFAEVRDLLVQETDYENEARETLKYAERLSGDSRFVVPRLYPEYSGPRVLATSLEKHIKSDDPLVRNLAQPRRNRLALHFMELYFKEIFEWGVVQTDPHLGNYGVRLSTTGEDQLVLFDFGAVRSYPPSFLDPYRRMVIAAFEGNKEALRKAALELRFLEEEDSEGLIQAFEEFCMMTVEPFIAADDPRNTEGQINDSGEYDWKTSKLPQRVTAKVVHMMKSFKVRPPPREILFLDRKTGGVFVFMAVLGAKVCARPLLLRYIEDLKNR